jgi:hypothetical protein
MDGGEAIKPDDPDDVRDDLRMELYLLLEELKQQG